MDRPSRLLAGWTLTMALGVLATGAGCRSMRGEVPPGKPYSTTGAAPGGVGFGSDPHPNTGPGGGLLQNGSMPAAPGLDPSASGMGPGAAQLGTPLPSGGQLATPTPGKYSSPDYTRGLQPQGGS